MWAERGQELPEIDDTKMELGTVAVYNVVWGQQPETFVSFVRVCRYSQVGWRCSNTRVY